MNIDIKRLEQIRNASISGTDRLHNIQNMYLDRMKVATLLLNAYGDEYDRLSSLFTYYNEKIKEYLAL